MKDRTLFPILFVIFAFFIPVVTLLYIQQHIKKEYNQRIEQDYKSVKPECKEYTCTKVYVTDVQVTKRRSETHYYIGVHYTKDSGDKYDIFEFLDCQYSERPAHEMYAQVQSGKKYKITVFYTRVNEHPIILNLEEVK